MKRHHVELAEASGHLWARCRCGWRGALHELRVVDRQTVIQAAERDAREHETNEQESSMMSLFWREQAACLDEDPGLFFPVGTTGPAVEQAETAKAVCRQCPVAPECLEWALANGQHDGIWGGLSEDERRRLRAVRRWRRGQTIL